MNIGLILAAITVVSPDGRNSIAYDEVSRDVTISRDGRVLAESPSVAIGVKGHPFSGKFVSQNVCTREGHERSPFYVKESVDLAARGTVITLEGGFSLELTARNDGVAWRWLVDFGEKPIEVIAEIASVRFPSDALSLWAGYPDQGKENGKPGYITNWESVYTNLTSAAAGLKTNAFLELPLVAEFADGTAVSVSESDQRDYPGWLLRGSGKSSLLKGEFAPEPVEEVCSGRYHHDNMTRHDYLAKTSGKRSFPWRVFMIADSAAKLGECDTVYALAEPCRIGDASWVKPGLAQWEWWHSWSVWDVPFRAGINTETYFHYIDFASQNGVPYVIIDGGWSVDYEIMHAKPAMDLKAICAHAAEKNVAIVLWSPWASFLGREEEACRRYAEIGVKGFKLDGICRNDRVLTKYLEDVAIAAAKYHQVVDYHGVSKPSGLSRTYPNVLTFEGVHGLENTKWEGDWMPKCDFLENDLTSVFCRMTAGPMDYTPGAMRNFATNAYHYSYTEPGSVGTRVRQMAMLVMYFSPLQMLCDSPTLYRREGECFGFMSKTPVVWDELVTLGGETGRYLAIARRKDKVWYIAAMTDSSKRTLELSTDFLGEGEWHAEVFADGVNADRNAVDYNHGFRKIAGNSSVHVELAPGGGWVARLER